MNRAIRLLLVALAGAHVAGCFPVPVPVPWGDHDDDDHHHHHHHFVQPDHRE
jgi:hypothetical protein